MSLFSFLFAVAILFAGDLSLLRADSSLTAQWTVMLPPDGRHVYRPTDGMFTARRAVSNDSLEKSDGVQEKSIATAGKRQRVKETKRQKDKETKRQRDKETKRQ
ncbi:MAG: hypothetical protein ACI3YC_02435, partial [Alloprevotella sp.]